MILVTGGSGVLGSALVDTLIRRGDVVVNLSSKELDLRNRDKTVDYIVSLQPDIIYHLAAKVHGLGGNTAFPAEMFTDNVMINMNVIEGARRTRAKIVAVSTVATYASDAPKPVKEVSIWDGPPHHSERAYGHAKRAMLAQLEACQSQYGLSFVYPIMTNIYGPHDRFDPVYGHVVPSLIAKFHAAATAGHSVDVWGTGVAERDFLHSTDAANALILLANKGEGAVNVATGSTVPIRHVVDVLAAHSGVGDVRWDNTKPDGQLERSYDVSRLTGFGWRPEVSIDDGLRSTYDWYASNFPNIRR